MIVNITHCPICKAKIEDYEAKEKHIDKYRDCVRYTYCKPTHEDYFHFVKIHDEYNFIHFIFTLGDNYVPAIKVKSNGECWLRSKDDNEDLPFESAIIYQDRLKDIDILDDDKVNNIFETLRSIKIFQ